MTLFFVFYFSEEALLMRLHLLQAIAAFICGHKTQAEPLFRLAKDELNKLKVPDEALEEVMAQGFTKTESRLALRACQSKFSAFKVLFWGQYFPCATVKITKLWYHVPLSGKQQMHLFTHFLQVD